MEFRRKEKMGMEGRNLDMEEIPENGQSMRGCALTYSRLKMENICQLWVLKRRDLNFCVRSTPLRVPKPNDRYKNY